MWLKKNKMCVTSFTCAVLGEIIFIWCIHTSSIHFEFDKRLMICIFLLENPRENYKLLIIQDSSVILDGLTFVQSNFSAYLGQLLYDVITVHTRANAKTR